MRNSRKTQLLIVAIVGIFLFSFIPTSQGYQKSGTTKRSLDDWLYSKGKYMYGDPLNPHIGAWASDTLSDPLIMFPHKDVDWNTVPVWECDYTGFVHDQEMSDGRRMITVHMCVKGVPVVVNEILDPENPTTLFVGEMDYIYIQKFIIDLDVWPGYLIGWADDDGFDDNGNILLPVYYIPTMPIYGSMMGFEFVSIMFIGRGKGTAVNDWDGLEPGDSAKVKVGQFGVANEDIIDWKIDYIKVY